MVYIYASRILYNCLVLVALIWTAGCEQDIQIKGEAGKSALKPQVIARGKQLFVASGCHACHGEDGSGDTSIAKTLRPPPRDFRDPQTYKLGAKVEEIAETIRKGIPSSGMPPYGHIKEEKREVIAKFIKSLQQEKSD